MVAAQDEHRVRNVALLCLKGPGKLWHLAAKCFTTVAVPGVVVNSLSTGSLEKCVDWTTGLTW